jgi:hypothetical protein
MEILTTIVVTSMNVDPSQFYEYPSQMGLSSKKQEKKKRWLQNRKTKDMYSSHE